MNKNNGTKVMDPNFSFTSYCPVAALGIYFKVVIKKLRLYKI